MRGMAEYHTGEEKDSVSRRFRRSIGFKSLGKGEIDMSFTQ